MKKLFILTAVAALLGLATGCADTPIVPESTNDTAKSSLSGASNSVIQQEPIQSPDPACWLTVGAFVGTRNSKDRFTGQAAPLDGSNSGPGTGCWRHTTASGQSFVGDVVGILCLRDGGDPSGGGVFSNLAAISAVGEWDGVSGYTASISIHDHGEPSTSGDPDHYNFQVVDPSGALVYSLDDDVDGGNVQIHSLDEPGWENIGPCGN